MANTVIYGGTFNPVHIGHVNLIRHIMACGEYDRLLLIPAASPPHKEAPALAPAQARIEMCRLATADIPNVVIDDWEIKKGGKSYTVDTITYLKKSYPNDSFFLLMGADMYLTFTQWKQWEVIGGKATLLVAPRESDDAKLLQKQWELLSGKGIASRLLHNAVVEISSTAIRAQLAQTGSTRGLTPKVEQYCKEHKLYGQSYNLENLRQTVKPLLLPERYLHSLCVEQEAVRLAEMYGGDANKAAAAGILHDICKNMGGDVLLQLLNGCDTITKTKVDFVRHPQLAHGFAGAEYIRRTLGIADEDLLNAVRYHTTARAGMSLLERIIYVADLTSSERDYPDVERMRDLANSSLDEALLYALEFITQDPDKCGDYTIEALREYRGLKQTGGIQ